MQNLKETLQKEYQGKNILVAGLGLQGGGMGTALFFARLGAKVTVTDLKSEKELKQSIEPLKTYPVAFRFGEHRLSDFLSADVIFKGPRIPWDRPEIIAALKENIPVEMETSFFASLCPAPIIGITGTRGKSTTTMLIYEVAKRIGKRVHLAGNLPQVSTINLLFDIQRDDLVVLELSSWQLSGFHRKKVSPHVGVLTNLYPDHLDYYPNMETYLFDKKAIYRYQTSNDVLIANQTVRQYIEQDKARGNVIYFSPDTFPGKLQYLKGVHNKENASAAFMVSHVIGCPKEKAIETITAFRGLPSRQEIVAETHGVIFVNDTTSTTPVAAEKAIETFSSHPVVILFGGNSKGLPYEDVIKLLEKTSRIVLLKGTFTNEILPLLQKTYPEKITKVFEDFQDAVTTAYREGLRLRKTSPLKKVYVLLSPGATSFAMFKNEFHRGEEFKKQVKTLVEKGL